MKLTKGKLSKLYKIHKQSYMKKYNKNKKSFTNNTFRKNKNLNLVNKTLKNINSKRGGLMGGKRNTAGDTVETTPIQAESNDEIDKQDTIQKTNNIIGDSATPSGENVAAADGENAAVADGENAVAVADGENAAVADGENVAVADGENVAVAAADAVPPVENQNPILTHKDVDDVDDVQNVQNNSQPDNDESKVKTAVVLEQQSNANISPVLPDITVNKEEQALSQLKNQSNMISYKVNDDMNNLQNLYAQEINFDTDDDSDSNSDSSNNMNLNDVALMKKYSSFNQVLDHFVDNFTKEVSQGVAREVMGLIGQKGIGSLGQQPGFGANMVASNKFAKNGGKKKTYKKNTNIKKNITKKYEH